MKKDCRSNRHKEWTPPCIGSGNKGKRERSWRVSPPCVQSSAWATMDGDKSATWKKSDAPDWRGLKNSSICLAKRFSAKTIPRRRQSKQVRTMRLRAKTADILSTKGIGFSTRKCRMDECCGHERCWARCVLPRVRSELRSTQRHKHGHEIHQ